MSSSTASFSGPYGQPKSVWIWTESKEVMTAAVERGWSTFVFSSQQRELADEWSSIALICPLYIEEGGIFDNGNKRVGTIFKVSNPQELELLKPENGLAENVVVDLQDWQIIPAENIVAAFQGSQKTVFAISKTPAEAQVFLEALEQGLGGVILKVEDSKDILELKEYFDRRSDARNILSLTKATVTRVQVAGMGDRVCVDLCSIMKPGEGLLVGSFARGLFLVHSECLESNYIASRPFRVNAGPVHAYVAVPGGKTCYLSELKAGKEVIVVDLKGQQRNTIVGRVKIETRPLVLVEAKQDSDDQTLYSILLQNAETVALVSPSQVVSLAASDWRSLEREAQALLESGWWNGYTNHISSRRMWPGIDCNSGGSITEISLPPEFQVGDKFDKFNFSSFPNLVRLQIIGQGITGNIPADIGTLQKLTHLDLSLNKMNGSIPMGIWNLTNLVTLNLARNMLIGSIPSTLGHLTSLISLDLSGNKISGSFATDITQFTKLEYLNLSSNQISGDLPTAIGRLSKLETLDLSRNLLKENIPSNLAECCELRELILSHNYFSGCIPFQIGYLFTLTTIDLSHNSISGEIPSQLGNITNSRTLDLSHNKLIGTIPHSLIFLRRIDLSYNYLRGSIPNDFLNAFACDAFIGNKELYVGELGCSSSASASASTSSFLNMKVFLPVTIFFLSLFSGYFLYKMWLYKKNREARATKNGDLFSIWRMGELHTRISSMQQRALTSNIVLEPEGVVAFTEQSYLWAKWWQ